MTGVKGSRVARARKHLGLSAILAAWLFLLPAVAPALATEPDCCPSLTSESWTRQSLAPGVELLQQHFDSLFEAAQYVNILLVDLSEPGVDVGFAAARQFGEDSLTLPGLGRRVDALAATNGGFMHGGPEKSNSGILKIDGRVFPFLKEEPEELRFVGSSALGIDEAGRWHFRERPGERWTKDWKEVEYALAGGHMLVSRGEISETVDREAYGSDREIKHAGSRHPRTAIGLTADSAAVVITVDGRHEEAEGLTLRELARLMKALGCEDAINLDGGGSTTMWTRRSGVVNHPSDNETFDPEGLRPIRSAVIITSDR